VATWIPTPATLRERRIGKQVSAAEQRAILTSPENPSIGHPPKSIFAATGRLCRISGFVTAALIPWMGDLHQKSRKVAFEKLDLPMHRGAIRDAPSNGGKMKSKTSILLLSMILCATVYAAAQDNNTEVQGFYQTYRNFDFKTGVPNYEISAAPLNGGGFVIAQNIAPWFAMWTQFSFYGKAEQQNIGVRIINNLEGVRYQTKQHGPLRLFVKGGIGFSRVSVDVLGSSFGETKFSAAYGGGAQLWFSEHFGVVLDVSHMTMGLPDISPYKTGQEKWDSGLTYTTALAVRF
jgi:hypothetical protein